MKILYIGNKLSVHGNNLSYMETLGPLLAEEGFNITYSSDKKSKVLRLLDMVTTLSRKRNKTDLVLIDTYSTMNYWYAIVIAGMCEKFNIPYIPILHGGNLPKRLRTSRKSLERLIGNSYCSVSPSEYLQSSLLSHGLSKVIVIRNTIPIEEYTFKPREVAQPKLLWVRSFSEIYNPQMAVHVLKLLKEKYPQAQLCMVGPDKDGSLGDTEKLANQLNVPVDFPGKMSKEAWRDLSDSYDIFISTTHFDNVPVSVLEAMSLGLPVVSTNVGGIPFMLEDKKTALLVQDNNIEQMCSAIIRLLESPELTSLLSHNARKESNAYSWSEVKKDWIELLNGVPLKSK